ncbi:TlpA family protein disulfide reductase [Chryseobacterium wanjuense]
MFQKNIIVFNIWATWCEPCLNEMSVLNKVKKQMNNNSDIVFLSYSLDNDSLKIKNFNASKRFDFKDITLENYSYKNSILLALDANKNEINNSIINISSTELPETFIIKNGKVVYIAKGTVNYEDFLEKLKSFK